MSGDAAPLLNSQASQTFVGALTAFVNQEDVLLIYEEQKKMLVIRARSSALPALGLLNAVLPHCCRGTLSLAPP